jgi:hypothetical protein
VFEQRLRSGWQGSWQRCDESRFELRGGLAKRAAALWLLGHASTLRAIENRGKRVHQGWNRGQGCARMLYQGKRDVLSIVH